MNSFSKTHFISKNSIELVVVKRNQPLESLKLIVFKLASRKDSGLLTDFFFHSMSQVIINGVGIFESICDIVFSLRFAKLVFILILIIPFLNQHFGSQFLQKFVCLAEELINFTILSFLQLIEIFRHILFLQQFKTEFRLFIFDFVFTFFLLLVLIPGLHSDLFPLFFLFAVELCELFFMDSHHLKHFFVFSFLSLLVVTLHLIFQFFHPITGVLCPLELFPSIIFSIKQLRFKNTQGFFILLKSINDSV